MGASQKSGNVGGPLQGTPMPAEGMCPQTGPRLIVEAAPSKAQCALGGVNVAGSLRLRRKCGLIDGFSHVIKNNQMDTSQSTMLPSYSISRHPHVSHYYFTGNGGSTTDQLREENVQSINQASTTVPYAVFLLRGAYSVQHNTERVPSLQRHIITKFAMTTRGEKHKHGVL